MNGKERKSFTRLKMKEAGHVPRVRLLEVGAKDDPVFTRSETEHVAHCSVCLAIFTEYFNKSLNSLH